MSVCVNPIERNRTTQRSTAIALVGIVLLGTLLRVIHLGTRSLWIDEGSSAVVARLDLHQFIRLVTTVEANMVLYYALLRFWMSWGDSETFIRALSVLFAVATLPLVYMLGARLFNTRVGLIGALLLSINAFHIRYAQEARGYSLRSFSSLLRPCSSCVLSKNRSGETGYGTVWSASSQAIRTSSRYLSSQDIGFL